MTLLLSPPPCSWYGPAPCTPPAPSPAAAAVAAVGPTAAAVGGGSSAGSQGPSASSKASSCLEASPDSRGRLKISAAAAGDLLLPGSLTDRPAAVGPWGPGRPPDHCCCRMDGLWLCVYPPWLYCCLYCTGPLYCCPAAVATSKGPAGPEPIGARDAGGGQGCNSSAPPPMPAPPAEGRGAVWGIP